MAQRTALAVVVGVKVGVVDCSPEQRSFGGLLRPPGEDTHRRPGFNGKRRFQGFLVLYGTRPTASPSPKLW